MKRFFKHNKKTLVFILSLIFIWRMFLFLPYFLGQYVLSQRQGFIGSIPWANFDGIHYLSIAQNGYFQYEQAFFPFFPLLIRYVSFLTFGNYLLAGTLIVHIALFLWLFLFYKLLILDFKETIVKWILVFYMFFPTSFFFGSIYTETVFLLFVVGAFYAARKQKWVIAGLFVGLASATKLIGIFLLPALLILFYQHYKKEVLVHKRIVSLISMIVFSISGLAAYMTYLGIVFKDPLFFIHAQPAFGANRTGGEIILLPQVLYRYIKIFLTVPFSQYDTWIALLEFLTMIGFLMLLWWGIYKRKFHVSYFLFSLFAITGPTLTGSLSSIPRYVLVAFPVFILFGMIKSLTIKLMLLFIFLLLLTLLTMYFLQGYFIA